MPITSRDSARISARISAAITIACVLALLASPAHASPAHATPAHASPAPTALAQTATSPAIDRANAIRRTGPVVAIGDSFIAGLGAGDYQFSAAGCRQSQRSATRLLAIRMQRSMIDLSCPNARLTDVDSGPLDINWQVRQVPRDAAFIVVGGGGNDIGFAHLAGPCLVAGAVTCGHSVQAARSRIPAVTVAMTRVLLQLRERARAARIVVMGYPPLIRSCTGCDAWLGAERVASLERVQAELDQALRTAAVRAGVRYLEPPPQAWQHTLCDAEPWFVMGDVEIVDELLHPTAAAARAMSAHLTRKVSRERLLLPAGRYY